MIDPLPDHVNIMGRAYRVVFEKLDDGTYAECSGMDGVIKINENEESGRRGTLVHEVLHAIFFETGLNKMIRPKVEEAIVSGLEVGLIRAGIIKEDLTQ